MTDFVVRFRIQQTSCCGTPPYWVSRQVTVQAADQDAARLKVLKLWSINNKIEIDRIDEKK